jgi:copper homeostasis protein
MAAPAAPNVGLTREDAVTTGTIEIAVQDLDGAIAAAAGGADRVEVCSALPLGGLTPSLAFITAAVQQGLPVHVLIRCREGHFEFTDQERALMRADVRAALRCGVDGVVVGATTGGMIDRRFISEVRDEAAGVAVTFHRAFDTVTDQAGALEELITLGVDRVLTSGGASSAADALDKLSALVRLAHGRIQVMAGGGITSANVTAVAATGVDAVHASAKAMIEDPLPIALGTLAGPGRSQRAVTDLTLIRGLRAALDNLP